ncbi:MAG: hypothetical protein KBB75_02245 [Candidatus Pacebacteria bacterium]|jgi:hypothetical protein|nr:hypothetical protein [Candidatus Paceibacterota bacterium]
MKTSKNDLFFMLTMFLVVTFFVLWLVVVDRSQQGIVDGLIMSILIGVTSYFCFLAGREDAQGKPLFKEDIKEGTVIRIISSLGVLNKKTPLNQYYMIELQNGEFCLLSLKDLDFIFRVGRSYSIHGTTGDWVMVGQP